MKAHYQRGGLGDMNASYANDILQELLQPIREKERNLLMIKLIYYKWSKKAIKRKKWLNKAWWSKRGLGLLILWAIVFKKLTLGQNGEYQ